MKSSFAFAAFIALSALMMFGCTYVDEKHETTETVVERTAEPWAPPGGYQQKVTYEYYPEREAYYNPSKREYIYSEKGTWKRSSDYGGVTKTDRHVIIEMEGEEPERYHEQVIKVYPPQ